PPSLASSRGLVVLGGSTPPAAPADGLRYQLKAACEVEPRQHPLRLDDGPCSLGKTPMCAQPAFQNVPESLSLGEPEPPDQHLLGVGHEPLHRQCLTQVTPLPPDDLELCEAFP